MNSETLEQRIERAFQKLYVENPDRAPTAAAILRVLGYSRDRMNGRENKIRKRLLREHGFIMHVRANRYLKTRRWCRDCGGLPRVIDFEGIVRCDCETTPEGQ